MKRREIPEWAAFVFPRLGYLVRKWRLPYCMNRRVYLLPWA